MFQEFTTSEHEIHWGLASDDRLSSHSQQNGSLTQLIRPTISLWTTVLIFSEPRCRRHDLHSPDAS